MLGDRHDFTCRCLYQNNVNKDQSWNPKCKPDQKKIQFKLIKKTKENGPKLPQIQPKYNLKLFTNISLTSCHTLCILTSDWLIV